MPTIRDTLYGMIKLSKPEFDLLDTFPLQRLRRIKQLAMANLLYPGANHTRFEHTLGVMHLSTRIADKLIDKRDMPDFHYKREAIRGAALLHDIGHGPFSHVFESVLQEKNKDLVEKGEIEEIHEQITLDIIDLNEDIKKCFDNKTLELVKKIIAKSMRRELEKEIVSGPLDADKYDYLIRDSNYTGVKYGFFDFERLLDTMTVLKNEMGNFIAFEKDGKEAVEQFLLAKYYMDSQVYRHRVRFITDHMIIKGLTIASDEIPELKNLTTYISNNEKFIDKYLNYYDEKIFFIIENSRSKKSKYYFERLYKRKLFKEVFDKEINDITDSPEEGLIVEKSTKTIGEEISKYYHIDSDFVIVKVTSLKDYTNIVAEQIFIDEEPLEQISDIFKASESEYRKKRVRVILPLDEIDGKKFNIYELYSTINSIIKNIIKN